MAARKFAWTRINFGIFSVAVSLIATIAFGDRLANDSGTIGVIATIFSILSGVLIAVISILGDPSMIMDQSWRQSYLKSGEIQRKLHRNTDVFVLYVVLLAACFSFSLLKSEDWLFFWNQRICFFLTILAFLASLSLPYSLKAIQSQRLAEAIEAMKKANQR